MNSYQKMGIGVQSSPQADVPDSNITGPGGLAQQLAQTTPRASSVIDGLAKPEERMPQSEKFLIGILTYVRRLSFTSGTMWRACLDRCTAQDSSRLVRARMVNDRRLGAHNDRSVLRPEVVFIVRFAFGRLMLVLHQHESCSTSDWNRIWILVSPISCHAIVLKQSYIKTSL